MVENSRSEPLLSMTGGVFAAAAGEIGVGLIRRLFRDL